MFVGKNLALPGRLEPTDLVVEDGQRVALVGPNGSGKTSLLRCMAGISGSAATLSIDGHAIGEASPARRAAMLSFLPASRQVDWAIPVRDLLRLSPLAPDPVGIETLVERLDLAAFLDRPANSLSTGERARVLTARALANGASLLLLDEPLVNLDPKWVLVMRDLIAEEAAAGRAVVAALHDLHQVDAFDRLVLMKKGRVVMDAPREEVMQGDAVARLFDLRRDAEGRLSL